MERKYFWVHFIIALALTVVATGFYNPILGVITGLVYYLFVWLIELYRECVNNYYEFDERLGNINTSLTEKIHELEKEVSELRGKTDVIEIPKRGKPRFRPVSNALDEVEKETLVEATEKPHPGDSIYRRKVDLTESDEDYRNRVKMEMSTVTKPNIQDLD